jgi:hypothetical protein
VPNKDTTAALLFNSVGDFLRIRHVAVLLKSPNLGVDCTEMQTITVHVKADKKPQAERSHFNSFSRMFHFIVLKLRIELLHYARLGSRRVVTFVSCTSASLKMFCLRND